MLNSIRVAVTGSPCSGKSTVCRLFEEWGATTVSADALLHDAFSLDSPIGNDIHELFGNDVFEGNVLIRSRVADLVTHTPELLTKLEDICHPFVNETIKSLFFKTAEKKPCLFVAEVPLLFESRYSLLDWFDSILVVSCDEELARKRYVQNGADEIQFSFRNARFMPVQEKVARADYVVENNQSLERLREKSAQIFTLLTKNCSQFGFLPQ